MKRKFILVLLAAIIAFSVFLASCANQEKAPTNYENNEPDISVSVEEIAATPTPRPQTNENAIPFPYGSYELYDVDGLDTFSEKDIQIEIYDDTSGTMFVSNFDSYEFISNNFNYVYSGDDLTINFKNGQTQTYTALFTEVGDLWLFDKNNPDIRYYYSYWNASGIFPNEYIFSAYGAWVIPNDNHTYSSICFWPSGRGYASNWKSLDNKNSTFVWQYANGALQIDFDNSDYHEEFLVNHMGNIVVLDGLEKLTLYRVYGDLITGYYRLHNSDDSSEKISELGLYSYNEAKIAVNSNGTTTIYDGSYWNIEPETGQLVINLDDENKLRFDYFYTGYGLLLFDTDTQYTYDMTEEIE